MGIVHEEEEDSEDQLENAGGVGSVLDTAEAFIKDFERSVVELVPTVIGILLA
jgi:hypothetical protein